MKLKTSTIFSLISITGVIATGILGVRAGRKGKKKDYIPPIIAGAATIGSIIAADRISAKQLAIATAAGIAAGEKLEKLRKQFSDYREAVIERMGEAEESEMRQSIVEENLEEQAREIEPETVHWFYEPWTKTMFEATKEDVLKALGNVNRELFDYGSGCGRATLADFYGFLNRKDLITKESERMGWDHQLLAVCADSYFLYFELDKKTDSKGKEYFEIYEPWGPEDDVEASYQREREEGTIY